MTEGIYNLCFLEVYNEFHDEVVKKIKQATREAHNRRIAVELTSYAAYCNKRLQNNGLDAEKDADDILQFMWHACPMMVLNEMGYSNFCGEWNYENGIFGLSYTLNKR